MKRERFPFCQRDPCLLPIFLLCLIEDFDFAFHLSYDFVTLILRPVYFLHFKNKAMTNTHSNFSKIAQNISVTTLHYSIPASLSSSCLNYSWKYRLSCHFQEYWQCWGCQEGKGLFINDVTNFGRYPDIPPCPGHQVTFVRISPRPPSTRYFDRDHWWGKSSKSWVPDKYRK